jgi:hypothetical protein
MRGHTIRRGREDEGRNEKAIKTNEKRQDLKSENRCRYRALKKAKDES